ncbi:pimeloyl-ACP methyl ester carboxylesterase [Dyadobacter jejuensis]|uniref:Pimeloyl-ACP methyl ester carboxylesterase n=1 Tax=Dyadobacter jejuensis TaxID=1082580 RepID=A0A316ANQ2_9BACT|nr:alpha/beta fold hydrolase [Dyadobacter jejuensis]PWJ58764.1 pimeloyl-ACP methyl ester carboxylesterase [Dyadobacter jejuensis]
MKLNFKKIGDSGPQLLILHGVFGFLDNWLTMGKNLADAGFQVYLVDQRNHGRSPHRDSMDYKSFADDLNTFITDHNLVKPILIGHSMGGKTVMQYAVQHPESLSKLVVVDIGPKQYPIHHQRLLEGLNHIDLSSVNNRQDADRQLAEYESNLGVRQFLLKNLYRTEENTFAWRFNLPVLTKDMPNVGQAITGPVVTAPTYFIRGGNSDYILDEDIPAIQQQFPAAQVITVPHSGHWIHAEQPQQFLKELLGILK